jgi:hypothetical protein
VQGFRASSTTPMQSLFLMNSDFAIRVAQRSADKLLADQSLDSDQDRVRTAHLQCFAAEPTSEQIQRDLRFVNKMLTKGGKKEADRRRFAWTAYCQSLIASAKFRFID